MRKKFKFFLASLCIFIIIIALFGKIIFIHLMGMLFFGFPETRVTALNDYSEPMMVGNTWTQDDLFEITLEQNTVVLETEKELKLVCVEVLVKNYTHYSNKDKGLECYFWVRDVEEENETEPLVYVKMGMSDRHHYLFYIPVDIDELILSTEIPTLDREHFYRKDWKIDTSINS